MNGRLPRCYQLEWKGFPLSILTIQSLFTLKLVDVLVFAWSNIVMHLVQEFAFSQNLSAPLMFNFWSASHVYCTFWEN